MSIWESSSFLFILDKSDDELLYPMVCNGLFDELNEEPDELVSTENGMGLVAKAVLMFSTNSSHWLFSTHERSPNESSM